MQQKEIVGANFVNLCGMIPLSLRCGEWSIGWQADIGGLLCHF